ncbi:MAG: TPM domain-containing protein [Betaproteobacteria bacterium]
MSWLKRFFRHVWMSPLIVKRSFSSSVLDDIERAVGMGEKTNRGQVRFVVEAELTTGQLWAGITSRQRALDVFSSLRVWDTEENNGVLVYVLLADRKVEIIADRGIHRHVGEERWNAICRELELHYRRRDFSSGSVVAVQKISAELAFYFPATGVNNNEQPDRPVVM